MSNGQLSPALFQEIVQLLLPLDVQLKTAVLITFHDQSVLNIINWEGSPKEVVIEVLDKLQDYDGTAALLCLLKALQNEAGASQQAEYARLIDALSQRKPPLPNPIPLPPRWRGMNGMVIVILLGALVGVLLWQGYQRLRDSNNEIVYYEAAKAALNSNPPRIAEALENLDRAIALNPEYILAYYLRAEINQEQGLYKLALADLDILLEVDKSQVPAYVRRAFVQHKLGNLTMALTDLNTAISLDPAYSDAYWGRGDIYYEQGKYADALVDYRLYLKFAKVTDATVTQRIAELEVLLTPTP